MADVINYQVEDITDKQILRVCQLSWNFNMNWGRINFASSSWRLLFDGGGPRWPVCVLMWFQFFCDFDFKKQSEN